MQKKIGIWFRNDENWTGGTYYILNLIHAIGLIPEEHRPEIFLICERKADFDLVKQQTGYNEISFIHYVSENFNSLNFFAKRKIKNAFKQLDLLFPYPFKDDQVLSLVKRKVYWIGDFQEKYLPEFFTEKALMNREMINQKISTSGSEVVFSSISAMKDFDRFYPTNNCTKFLLQFAVTHPEIDSVKKEDVFAKYGIQAPYFISPNQFWIHKNHLFVIDAVKKLRDAGHPIRLYFTGKEYDYRYPEYTDMLKKKVQELNLQDHIFFLGFIDRVDQLVLMKNATAVVQASLFEGWSTVVEDAKALDCHLILSDLPVHKEQNPSRVTWFNPHDSDELMKALLNIQVNVLAGQNDYEKNKRNYVNQFIAIVEAKK